MYQAGFVKTLIDGLTFINEFFLVPLSLILTVIFIYLGYPLLGIYLYKFKNGGRNKNIEVLIAFLSLLCAIFTLFPIVKLESEFDFGNNNVEWKAYFGLLSSLTIYYSGIFFSRKKDAWVILTSWIMGFIGIGFSLFCALLIFMIFMPGPPP